MKNIIIIIICVLAIYSFSGIFSKTENTTVTSSITTTVTPTRECEIGSPVTGKLYITKQDVNFYTSNSTKSKKVVNQKASEILKRTEYRTLAPEYSLTALCKQDGWIQAEISEVAGSPVTWETGWIQEKYVSGTMTEEQKQGLIWDINNEPDLSEEEKTVIKQGALKVLKSEANCKSIVTGDRSATQKGKYYVTCYAKNGGEPFNIWFSPDEVRQGRNYY